MKYRVICGGILKANGELAPFNTELDEIELDDPTMRVKEGYVEVVKGSDKPAPAAKSASAPAPAAPVDNSAAIKAAVDDALVQAAIDKQAEIDAAVKQALADKQAEIDAANQDIQNTDGADLLNKAKGNKGAADTGAAQ